MHDMPGGPGWLNTTLVFAGCYEEAHPTTGSSTKATATATTGSKATSSGPKPTTTSTSTATSTSKANNVVGRAESVEMWMVAGTGLAVTAINSML
ncbi:hypothetical protein TrVFT333_011283 [Trichoderma virens FT-333]|nr:hypothetical protein TrVFT333_011283 [Trichoderma virens FT-333]